MHNLNVKSLGMRFEKKYNNNININEIDRGKPLSTLLILPVSDDLYPPFMH